MASINASTSGAGGVITTADATGTLQLQSASTTVATVNAFGIGLGTGVPSSGIGITFPATQSASSDANTLDDYEEGTWTPIYIQSTTNPTVTYGGTAGFYRKIGSFVYAAGRIATDSISGGSGNVSIGGLPFTVANLAQDNGSFDVGVSFSWATNTFPSAGFASKNTTSIVIVTANGADARSGVDARITSLQSGAGVNGIVFSCCYIASD